MIGDKKSNMIINNGTINQKISKTEIIPSPLVSVPHKSQIMLESREESDSDSESGGSEISSSTHIQNQNINRKRKRNDPEVFATSMSKILNSKLTASKRSDPVLARSVEAQHISKQVIDAKLESMAMRKIRGDKKELLEKGRIKNVLNTSMVSSIVNPTDSDMSFQVIKKEEEAFRKIAQRGVIKLFNAVRAAQKKGEVAASEVKAEGIVSQRYRQERINEMSKKGFLDLIAKGGDS